MKTPSEADEPFAAWQRHFETVLDQHLLPETCEPSRLHQAMRYSALSGGKRIRPLLVYASGQLVNPGLGSLDAIACAVELIHAYSLIHDDLPAMDDDDLRRGRATCHLAFDEATAILAGDALQALAFRILAGNVQTLPRITIRLVSELAQACGSSGMAGGQMMDLQVTGRSLDIAVLEHIHELKTGALIRYAVLAPGYLAGSDSATLDALAHYGRCVGLGFQIRDDILDVIGDSASLGKNPHADAERDKPTFPALIGLDASHKRAGMLLDEALECLGRIKGDTRSLASLAEHMVSRDC
ncbi:MAG TPA: farnesyl diphosphate synthase [Xanthomonadales bacterium]|nr:farnesyl diphosphate synthase [Xanthomonadales bacterium]